MKQNTGLIWGSISLGLLMIIVLLVRIIVRQFQRRAEDKAQRYKTEMDNAYLNAQHQAYREIKDQMYELATQAGYGVAIQETFLLMGDMGKALGELKIQSDNVENYRKQLKIDQQSLAEAYAQNKQLQKEVDEANGGRLSLKNRVQYLENMLKGTKQPPVEGIRKIYDLPPKPPADATQMPPRSVADPSNMPRDRLAPPSPMHLRPIDEDTVPLFRLRNDDKRFTLSYDEDLSQIQVYQRGTHELLARIDPGTIRKGEAMQVLPSGYLIWCALPQCEQLKLSKNKTVRTCCTEHMRALEKIERTRRSQGL